MFNGETLIVDRKTGQQTYFVPSASVSISGGIQPGILTRALPDENRQNGIAARFLFTMPPRKPRRWTEAEIPEQAEAALEVVAKRGCARWIEVPPGPKGGRPTRRLELLTHTTQLNLQNTEES